MRDGPLAAGSPELLAKITRRKSAKRRAAAAESKLREQPSNFTGPSRRKRSSPEDLAVSSVAVDPISLRGMIPESPVVVPKREATRPSAGARAWAERQSAKRQTQLIDTLSTLKGILMSVEKADGEVAEQVRNHVSLFCQRQAPVRPVELGRVHPFSLNACATGNVHGHPVRSHDIDEDTRPRHDIRFCCCATCTGYVPSPFAGRAASFSRCNLCVCPGLSQPLTKSYPQTQFWMT